MAADKRRRGRARAQCTFTVGIGRFPGTVGPDHYVCVKTVGDDGTHTGEHDLQPEHSK